MKLKKYSILTQARGNLTLNDRKIFNYLLYLKQTQNSTDNICYTSLEDIKQFLKTKYNSRIILNSLNNLTHKELQINLINKDKNISQNQTIKILEYFKRNKDFSIEYKFSDTINNLETKINLYSYLDIKIIATFKSKYSIALYEFINDNKKVSIPTLTIDNFKSLLGANYPNYSVLKNKAIDIAISEINTATTLKIDFTVKKLGRKVKLISFTFLDIARDKTFKLFIDFMIKKYNHKIIKTKTNEVIIDKKLKANQWKKIFLNKEKLPFFNVCEFEYFVVQNNIKKRSDKSITKKKGF